MKSHSAMKKRIAHFLSKPLTAFKKKASSSNLSFKLTFTGYISIAVILFFLTQALSEDTLATKNLLFLIASILSAFFISTTMLAFLNIAKIELDIDAPKTTHAQKVTFLTLKLRKKSSWFPSFLLTLSPLPQKNLRLPHLPLICNQLLSSAHAKASLKVKFLFRGQANLPTIKIQSLFPLGFAVLSKRFSFDRKIKVYPQVVQLPQNLIGQLGLENKVSHFGQRQKSLSGEGDVSFLREYRPGESMKRIHWRTSARFGKLTLIEQEIPKKRRLHIILDTFFPLKDHQAKIRLEQSLSLCASFIKSLQSLQHTFSSFTFSAYGSPSRQKSFERQPSLALLNFQNTILDCLVELHFAPIPLQEWLLKKTSRTKDHQEDTLLLITPEKTERIAKHFTSSHTLTYPPLKRIIVPSSKPSLYVVSLQNFEILALFIKQNHYTRKEFSKRIDRKP